MDPNNPGGNPQDPAAAAAAAFGGLAGPQANPQVVGAGAAQAGQGAQQVGLVGVPGLIGGGGMGNPREPKEGEYYKYDGKAHGKPAERHMFLAKTVIDKYTLPVTYAPRFFIDGALDWIVGLIQLTQKSGQPLTWDVVWEKYTDTFCYDKCDSYDVRTKLHAGEIRQQYSQSVGEYMSSFSTTIMYAPDLSETDKIHWFHKGLIPELRSETVCDVQGAQWKTLSDLYKFAKGLEQRMVANGTRYIGARSGSYGQSKRGGGHFMGKNAGMLRPKLAGIQKKKHSVSKVSIASSSGQVAGGAGPINGREHAQLDPKKDAAYKKWCIKKGLCILCGKGHQKGHNCGLSKNFRPAHYDSFVVK